MPAARRPRASLALACLLGLAACAPKTVAPAQPIAPATAMDPPPYTPRSSTVGAPGEPTGLAVASGFDQAERVALELVEAIRVGDAPTLSRLFAERLARTLPFFGAAHRRRDQVMASLLAGPRRRGLEAAVALSDLVIVERVDVAPLATYLGSDAPPEGLRASDLVVSVPMADLGRRYLRRLVPGWVEHGRVVVRVGPEPRIVGL